MTVKKRGRTKKYFTVAEANAMLPLLRSILRDVTDLARDLRERHERLSRVQPPPKGSLSTPYQEEVQQMQDEFEREQARMEEYVGELKKLGVELKDPFMGLLDFPTIMDDHEVYLCWRLGETEVGHWHELDAGFAGRRKLMAKATTRP
jgi:hypothetical protein